MHLSTKIQKPVKQFSQYKFVLKKVLNGWTINAHQLAMNSAIGASALCCVEIYPRGSPTIEHKDLSFGLYIVTGSINERHRSLRNLTLTDL